MKILVTIPKGIVFDSFVPPVVQSRLAELGDVEYNHTTEQFTPEHLKERLQGVDVVVTGWGTTRIDESVLSGNDSLKIIAHTGGTVHNIASDYVYDRGIKVLSGNDIYAESVAESVIGYALAALRKIPDYVNLMRSGGWDEIPVWEGLLERKIGLVGFGMTTRHLVRMLAPFRCKVFVYSSHLSEEYIRENNLTRATLEEIFSNCEIVSLHSAMTPKNYHMIDRRLMEMLDENAILINTARGGIIDEEALTDLLRQGRFRAVLDVFEAEENSPDQKLPSSHPLRSIPSAYLIPHRAGPTYDRRKSVTLALADDIERIFKGETPKLEITREYAGYMTR